MTRPTRTSTPSSIPALQADEDTTDEIEVPLVTRRASTFQNPGVPAVPNRPIRRTSTVPDAGKPAEKVPEYTLEDISRVDEKQQKDEILQDSGKSSDIIKDSSKLEWNEKLGNSETLEGRDATRHSSSFSTTESDLTAELEPRSSAEKNTADFEELSEIVKPATLTSSTGSIESHKPDLNITDSKDVEPTIATAAITSNVETPQIFEKSTTTVNENDDNITASSSQVSNPIETSANNALEGNVKAKSPSIPATRPMKTASFDVSSTTEIPEIPRRPTSTTNSKPELRATSETIDESAKGDSVPSESSLKDVLTEKLSPATTTEEATTSTASKISEKPSTNLQPVSNEKDLSMVSEPPEEPLSTAPVSNEKDLSTVSEPSEEPLSKAEVKQSTSVPVIPAQRPIKPRGVNSEGNEPSLTDKSATAVTGSSSEPKIPSNRPVREPPKTGSEEPVIPLNRPLSHAKPEGEDKAKVLPSVPARPSAHSKASPPSVPTRPKRASVFDDQMQQQLQANSSPTPIAKPKPPAKLNKIGALQASLFQDLNNVIARGGVPIPMGAPKPKPKTEASQEKDQGDDDGAVEVKKEKKLGDVRRGRAKGPKRKLPSVAKSTVTIVLNEVWTIGPKNLEVENVAIVSEISENIKFGDSKKEDPKDVETPKKEAELKNLAEEDADKIKNDLERVAPQGISTCDKLKSKAEVKEEEEEEEEVDLGAIGESHEDGISEEKKDIEADPVNIKNTVSSLQQVGQDEVILPPSSISLSQQLEEGQREHQDMDKIRGSGSASFHPEPSIVQAPKQDHQDSAQENVQAEVAVPGILIDTSNTANDDGEWTGASEEAERTEKTEKTNVELDENEEIQKAREIGTVGRGSDNHSIIESKPLTSVRGDDLGQALKVESNLSQGSSTSFESVLEYDESSKNAGGKTNVDPEVTEVNDSHY